MKLDRVMHASSRVQTERVLVWDLPLRLFHGLLAAAFLTAWLTRDARYLHVHAFAGYAVAALLAFRLVWGFVGGVYARFGSFTFGWRAVRDYLAAVAARRPSHFLGHNPAGSWAVYALLALSLLIVLSGVLTLGGEEQHGPLAGWLDFAQGERAHTIHAALAWIALGTIVIHLAGVAVESWLQRENLPRAMLTGYKRGRGVPTAARGGIAILVLVTLLGAAGVYFRGAWSATAAQPYLPYTGPTLPDDARWRMECGGCHLAYHPTLLPARGWRQMMTEQQSHFGEDLALDDATVTHVTDFLVTNSAERALSEPAWKIHRSTPADATPLRITELPYWRHTHDGMPAWVWKSPQVHGKHDCAACHLDAERGTFEDGAMRLPPRAR
jgi:cytochrome b